MKDERTEKISSFIHHPFPHRHSTSLTNGRKKRDAAHLPLSSSFIFCVVKSFHGAFSL